jgi:cytochrome c556
MQKPRAGKLITMVVAATIVTAAHADPGESNEAKYRHSVMEAIGLQFGAIATIFTKRVDRQDELVVHAEALALTSSLTAGLFPEGSEGGHALPLIWEEPDKVAAAAEESVVATAALAEAARSGDQAAIAKAFKDVGASCKACHERYKEEDD